MSGSTIAVLVSALITGVIIADILAHPQGTQAAANGIAGIARPSLDALLGVSSQGRVVG